MGFFDFLKNKGKIESPEKKQDITGKGDGQTDPQPFLMKIDDVFSIPKRGTIVTGKIDSGTIKLHDEVIITGGDQPRGAKVIGIEKSNKFLDKAEAGDSVGLLMGGISENSVKKGYIVADTHHPIIESYSEVEIIPAEERIKDAIMSSNGLYPHEVLVLNYAPKYYTDTNDFQKFWWYRYGVKDVGAILSSLEKRGFLQRGDLNSSLEKETVETLKNALKTLGLKTSGKKADLIQRLCTEIPEDKLTTLFPRRVYQLTELGKEEIAKEEYVHHTILDLDLWALNKLVYSEPYQPYRDKIWAYLNRRGGEYLANGDFGLYRNCRYSMASFLIEADKTKESLQMLAEVVFYDLCGTGNNYNPDTLDIAAEHFFPYESSLVTVAPGIIQEIMECKEELEYSDEELRNVMVERISRLSAPIKLFTPDECVDIVMMEYREDTESLKKIYSKAKQKFKKDHPNIRLP